MSTKKGDSRIFDRTKALNAHAPSMRKALVRIVSILRSCII